MTARDIDLLQHRIDSLTRAATRIRRHVHDLHSLAWDRSVTGGEKVRETKIDHVPRVADEAPRARHVWEHLVAEVARCEDILVGLERQVVGYFMVSSTAEPTRGSHIPAAEHARLLANQQARTAAGDYTPARLIDQPAHPGKKR